MDIPPAALNVLLDDAITREKRTARRAALLNIFMHERYLTREQLVVRVEGMLGRGCFGDSAWIDTFYRDMKVVKRAFMAAGYQIDYSRSLQRPGYYLQDRPAISSDLSAILDGSIADVDRSQIAIFKRLSYRQRFHQGCSISNLAHQVVANRIRGRNPKLSLEEAYRIVFQDRVQQ